MKKTIKFQEKVTVWQESVAIFECPDDETDAETFARLRRDGPATEAEEWDSTRNFDESEEAIPDTELGTNHTIDFTASDSCGVIARDGVSCDPEFAEEDEDDETFQGDMPGVYA